MELLRRMPRPVREEHKPVPDPLEVFREFLDHLDRVARHRRTPRAGRHAKARTRRNPR